MVWAATGLVDHSFKSLVKNARTGQADRSKWLFLAPSAPINRLTTIDSEAPKNEMFDKRGKGFFNKKDVSEAGLTVYDKRT